VASRASRTAQLAPELWQDRQHVEPSGAPGYHLSEDLADRAMGYVGDHLSATLDRPFFLYLAFGACHAPHQAPRAFIDAYRGAFDDGWDVERGRVSSVGSVNGRTVPRTCGPVRAVCVPA